MPLLKQLYQINCLKLTKCYKNWIIKDWKRVLSLDKINVNRIGSDKRAYTWKQKEKPLSNQITLLLLNIAEWNLIFFKHISNCLGYDRVGDGIVDEVVAWTALLRFLVMI